MTRGRGIAITGLVGAPTRGGADAGPARSLADSLRRGTAALVDPAPAPGEAVREVDVSEIDRSPYQARRVFREDELADLAASVAREGLLQPIVLRRRRGGRYELVAGERRWLSFKRLGRDRIPSLVRDIDDVTAHLLGQVENDARADISAWERARGLVELRDHIAAARGAVPSQRELAEFRGLDETTLSKYVRVGEAFTPEVLSRAGITEAEAASINLNTLVQAARRPAKDRIPKLRDVLRKREERRRQAPGGAPATGDAPGGHDPPPVEPGGTSVDAAVPETRERSPVVSSVAASARADAPPSPSDVSPRPGDRRPATWDHRPAPEATRASGWRQFWDDRAIRVETQAPVREMTVDQAAAAVRRMIGPLAALAARIADAGAEAPMPMRVGTEEGLLIFVPAGGLTAAQEDLLTDLFA